MNGNSVMKHSIAKHVILSVNTTGKYEHNEIKMQERTLNISNKLFSGTMNNKLGVAFQEM